MVEDKIEIEFVKLKVGTNHLTYNIDKTFFDQFENTHIPNAEIQVNVTLEKHNSWMDVSFNVNGYITTTCDRCLQTIDYPVYSEYRILYKYAIDETQEDTEEVKYLKTHDFKIDITLMVFETILLDLPMVKYCDDIEELECDTEMLKKIKENQKNQTEEIDPRWQKLKDIK